MYLHQVGFSKLENKSVSLTISAIAVFVPVFTNDAVDLHTVLSKQLKQTAGQLKKIGDVLRHRTLNENLITTFVLLEKAIAPQ